MMTRDYSYYDDVDVIMWYKNSLKNRPQDDTVFDGVNKPQLADEHQQAHTWLVSTGLPVYQEKSSIRMIVKINN